MDDRDPYATPNHEGDKAAARAEMSLSRYDRDQDGRCDGRVCAVTFLARREEPHRSAEPVFLAALRAIGLEPEVERPRFPNGYLRLGRPTAQIEVSSYPGWAKDYVDPFTFMDPLFHSRDLNCGYTNNYSLVGASEGFAERCDLPGNFKNVPNVDADIDACQKMYLSAERRECWRDLDDKIMEEVVPWVPYMWGNRSTLVGPRITSYEFDRFTEVTSFTHLEVAPSRGLTP
jgi:ABC-type transport system substrate-binding protein